MRRYMSGLLAAAVLALSAGCAQKFTQERFGWIRAGVDDREDVRRVLGDPHYRSSEHWYYEDPEDHTSAMIYFDEQGRVSGKQWLN
ncbi:MAG: hypothetical protein CHACPFDD_03355 [Phycisphaerae bacterium]|nr:hypothetical protein [Phycisphaerae bacterium]